MIEAFLSEMIIAVLKLRNLVPIMYSEISLNILLS